MLRIQCSKTTPNPPGGAKVPLGGFRGKPKSNEDFSLNQALRPRFWNPKKYIILQLKISHVTPC